MRRSLWLLAITACSGSATIGPGGPPTYGAGGPAPGAGLPVEPTPLQPPDPELAKLDIDWAATPLAADADAVAVWKRIVPTSVDWELRVAQIPDDKLEPLIGALLRGGNLACAGQATATACQVGPVAYPDPAPTATFDDPCLRRALALWAVSSIGQDQVEALAPALIAIAGTSSVDDEMVGAVATAVRDQPEATRMELLAAAAGAGHAAAIQDDLSGLSEEALAKAATELHIDAAVEALDVEYSRPVYLAAVRDRGFAQRTRLDVIADLLAVQGDKPLSRELDKALTEAARDPDCIVAAAAATALVQAGKPHAVPSRPRTKKPADAMRALCVMAAADLPDAAAAFVGPRGLKVVERSFDPDLEFLPDDPNLDGDGDPRTERTVETVTRRDFEDIPFDTDIPTAMTHCTGTTCSIPALGIELAFGFVAAKDGGLWLDTIERRDLGTCGQNLPQ